jgi:hypothetical protein
LNISYAIPRKTSSTVRNFQGYLLGYIHAGTLPMEALKPILPGAGIFCQSLMFAAIKLEIQFNGYI